MGFLRKDYVVWHSNIRHIHHVEKFYAPGAVLPLLRGTPVSMFCFAWLLGSWGNISEHRVSQRGRAVMKLYDTGMANAHNATLAHLLTLRHCQVNKYTLLFLILSRYESRVLIANWQWVPQGWGGY